MPNLTVVPAVDQTSPRDAGHTTSEHFWTKILVILGTVIAIGGQILPWIDTIAPMLPPGFAKWALVVGAGIALAKSIAYDVSRTIVKMRLAKADEAIEIAKLKSPEDAAAVVLGSDAPERS